MAALRLAHSRRTLKSPPATRLMALLSTRMGRKMRWFKSRAMMPASALLATSTQMALGTDMEMPKSRFRIRISPTPNRIDRQNSPKIAMVK